MVDLTEYARSLESDLPYVRGKIAMLETGTLQEGVRRPGKELGGHQRFDDPFDKRIVGTYEASLIAVKAKLQEPPS